MNSKRLILFVLFYASCIGSKKTSELNEPLKNISIFSDFQLLDVPRDNISIGSEWSKFGLSSNQSSSVNLIESKSFSNFNIESNTIFSANLKISLLKLFGITGDLNVINKYNLILDSLAIVRVSDLKQLNFSPNKIYIWEGIKVKSLSLVSTVQAIDTINLKLDVIRTTNDPRFYQVSDQMKKVSLTGMNLFFAYRLVRIGGVIEKNLPLSIKTYNDIINNDKIIGINSFRCPSEYNCFFYKKDDYIKTNYISESDFIKEQNDKIIWPEINYNSNFYWILQIECLNELINSEPRLYKFKVGLKDDSSGEDYSFNLQSRMMDNLLVRDVLQIKNLQNLRSNDIYSGKKSALLFSKGSIIMRRYTIRIENYIETEGKGL